MDQTKAGLVMRVFLSHASQDAAAAAMLAAALESQSIPCWIAPRDIAPGMRYGEAIIDGINACSLFVLLLSPYSNSSPQVLAEVERAVSKGLTILTVRLESVALTKSLEYFLSSFHWIDAFPATIESHLARLTEAIRQGIGNPAPPAPVPSHRIPNRLPRQLTSFIGRNRQVAAIESALHSTGLLTLTGSGGTGKTRLSLQVAAQILADGTTARDGIWFIELASLSDPALVGQTVAEAVAVHEQPGVPIQETLGEALHAKRLVLILDNCEHVVSGCADLVAGLLRVCPDLKILASSREPLGVWGETVFRVPPLSLPDSEKPLTAASLLECEAAQLFDERARAARPDFAVTDANALTVASICRRLDGIPFALELAASRLRSMSLDDVSTRLDYRFRLLTGGSKTLLPRQQTLRALIDWSYDLLTDQEQALLCRLSVFAGGWSLASAESVCTGAGIAAWEVMDLMTALVDKSLVSYAETGGVGRYRLLETVRHYAGERLEASGAGASSRNRHFGWCAALAEEAGRNLTGPDQGLWLSRLDEEHDNLREAMAWCQTEAERGGSPEQADLWLRFCSTLLEFWEVRGYLGEGRERLNRALRQTEHLAHSPARIRAHYAAGTLAWRQGDYVAAQALIESSLAAARRTDDQPAVAAALNRLGTIALAQGDFAAAQPFLEECLDLRRQLGDQQGIAIILGNLGAIAGEQGDYIKARLFSEESLSVRRRIGNPRSIAYALSNLGAIAGRQQDFDTAQSLFGESLDIFQQIGDQQNCASILGNLGDLARIRHRFAAARQRYQESLGIYRLIGDQEGMIDSLERVAKVRVSEGDALRAGRLWGAATALRAAIGCRRALPEQEQMDEQYALVRDQIGEQAWTTALGAGEALALEAAIAEALR